MSEVLIELPGSGVAIVRINRPEAHNALNAAVRAGLAKAFAELETNEEVRCVVLAGSEKVFAAGADIKAMAEASPAEMTNNGADHSWRVLREFSKPVIAAVNGWSLGGGCELAMHADIIIAGEGARFGQPEIKVGIIPGAGGTQRLTRAVGKFKAMKILLTGEAISAREAEAMGLVSEVVADEAVFERALALANVIAALPSIAARKIKELVLAGADLPLNAALSMERQAFWLMFDTVDQKEGMRAFIEKRSPVFTGK
ncbi:short chain enoyl-CoA hydratase [Paucimonas lemoignei]|uniref:Short chain enoyl-CoA hydratase n=1 Tax=Paucimonas lemoignei TaxID=29443 RepID=A0A4R3I305_PAULE|nr:enoyl-CoA hydratase-related protein [Paucimonas lemoignei]TCS39055.1 short chain enoyl-CoA hydratase [Paucimonas lemoignei]